MLRTESNSLKISLLIFFAFLFLLFRLPRLGSDENNPDGVNWYYRSEQFVVALKTFHLENTYQHYHPGATLMWQVGFTTELIKQMFPEYKVINKDNFEVFHTFTKIFLVMVQLGFTFLAFWLLSKIIGFYKSLLVTTLYSLEPFFIGNSRIVHLDILMTLFILISFCFAYLGLHNFWPSKRKNLVYVILSGVFVSLAFLTKSSSVLAWLYLLVFGSFIAYKRFGFKQFLRFIYAIIVATLITLPIVLPAFLVDVQEVFVSIFSEAERIGARDGHGQIVFGEYTRDPGFSFYFLVLLLKISFVSLLGFVVYSFIKLLNSVKNVKAVFHNLLNSKMSFYVFYGLFCVLYILGMSLLSKKIDRYVLVIYPWVAMWAVLGWEYLFKKLKNYLWIFWILLIVFIFGTILGPLLNLYPYYFVYTDPVFGDSSVSHQIIAQKPFGVAIFDLKNRIQSTFSVKYGEYPKIGMYDTKPLKSIYPNSKVFDVRVYGPGKYDLLVLGPNEGMPENINEDNSEFELVASLSINGLDYWRVYAKK